MRPIHLKWWLQKYKHLDSLAYDSIDWKAIGNARKYISGTDEVRLVKYLNGWLNTGRQKGHQGKDPSCPCCGAKEETQLHMFQCQSAASRQAHKQAFKNIATDLCTLHLPLPPSVRPDGQCTDHCRPPQRCSRH